MIQIGGQSRYQVTLFPEVADDFVASDHPVRVIDAFVDSLDLARLGFSQVEAGLTGRPPYVPAHLLKLYIYGIENRVRSSRTLQREAAPNLEELWLIDQVRPSYPMIADFRKDHVAAIIKVWHYFEQPERMVNGYVCPPAIELVNRDLIEAHFHAIWIAETGGELSADIPNVLDLTATSLPVQDTIAEALSDLDVATRAAKRMGQILASINPEMRPKRRLGLTIAPHSQRRRPPMQCNAFPAPLTDGSTL